MKKLITTLLLSVCLTGLCLAQSTRSAGSFYVYDYEHPAALTAAPEGYEPFYISHFARHGARYCTSEYDGLYEILSKAAAEGVLTEQGKAFFDRYKPFYGKVKDCKGNLTGVGKAQHRAIAEHMYARFPQVFEGPTHVEAVSTEAARVIMSMWSCLNGLTALDRDLSVSADASAKYASWLQPNLSSNPYYNKKAFAYGKTANDAAAEYFRQVVPCKEIVERFFTSEDALKDLNASSQRFLDLLHSVVVSTWCLDEDRGCFDDVLSPEESEALWKGMSTGFTLYSGHYEGSECRWQDYVTGFTIRQIIESADADIASGKTQLRLRFGHDAALAPLLAALDVNSYGRVSSTFDEAREIYPSYAVPMGCSLQLVFYRNADGDILLKALVNESEATLPLEPVSGPYYRWSDFKEYFLPRVYASYYNVKAYEPLAVLKATDWGWKPVENSKVEAGGATLKVFGGTQTVSLIRFPMKDHAVSVVSAPGAKAGVTSQLAVQNKALAAVNGSFFDGDNMPITYLKDEGRVVSKRVDGEANLFNGMFRIKDKKGRFVDITVVDSLSTAAAAKGWREAIVSGPVLLNEGQPVYYQNDGSRTYRRFYRRRHPRTLLGYTQDGWMYFIVVDGRFPLADGMNVFEMQVLCQSLGLYEALNLDGGGSATMWASGLGVLNHPYDNQVFDHEGERVVPNAIIVK
ncbi:MAG: phosphodiester glycosidase family protein [Bacteroidales bacterium]|nr:phosphodiester glycosidase family protein [Bacteroidales bacterium]